jgi:hypothetical protein
MTNLGILLVSVCKAVHTHQDGADEGAREVRGQLDAVGRKYVRMTRRLLAMGRDCSAGTGDEAFREAAKRWKRGHRDCATRLAKLVDLDVRIVADVLHRYREAIKRGPVSSFGDWIIEMSKLESDEDGGGLPTTGEAVQLH